MAENYYDEIAAGYNTLYGEEQQVKLNAISKMIADANISLENRTLLDVGCGTGISSDYFAEKYDCTVYGIDPSKELIAQNTNGTSQLQVGFAERMPFEDNQFDVVVSVSAIQNFSDIQKGLDEIKRVGKSIFILTFMSKNNPAADEISRKIEQTFTVQEKRTVKNDTVFFCSN